MLQIKRVYSATLDVEVDRVRQVQALFRESFQAAAFHADTIPDHLNYPFKFGYRMVLLVSEAQRARVTGFSMILHFPEVNSSLLDFIAVSSRMRGHGIGSALYEATREYLQLYGSRGLYLESPSDDPERITDPEVLRENRRRMAFYEQHGARPIMGTEFETPIREGGSAPPLLFDPLGRKGPLRRSEARAAVRILLTRKYGTVVPPDYIERVVESFVDDPVRLREPRYPDADLSPRLAPMPVQLQKSFSVVSCEQHKLHVVHEQGYVERPARVDALRDGIGRLTCFDFVAPRHYGEEHIRAVHDNDFVSYLKAVCEKLDSEHPVYPYVFPIRRPERKPRDLAVRAGYYCIDTFTPLDRNAYRAARSAVDVALTAADEILAGRRVAYAICRPPGHHAERRVFGGFCYFNNAAVAAHRLSRAGRVAVLDIDFHHGNGTQDIFYSRSDVLTVSIHGHPNFAYPYFSGFADERGEGEGVGFNRNFPLPEQTSEEQYLDVIAKALDGVKRFNPLFMVVSLGLDTMRGDPTGTFSLRAASLRKIGAQLGQLPAPLLVVQEGGYNIRNLRSGVNAFFAGLCDGIAETLRVRGEETKA